MTDYSHFEACLEAEQATFEAGLRPIPQTETFSAEMDNPIRIPDEISGRSYGVYQVNQDQPGTPLVMNMSWSEAVGSKTGRSEVNAYASRITRPIIVIDMEGHGETDPISRPWHSGETFDTLAAAHLRIVYQLGIDDFDIQGMSMGGVVAAKMAEQAGERVGKLTTISTVSLEDRKLLTFFWGFGVREAGHQRRYVKSAPEEVSDVVDSGFVGSLRGVSTLLCLATMMTKETVLEAIMNLSPRTQWHDFVGSAEEVTDWRRHLEIVRARNKAYPRSSSLHVLGGETHAWSSIYLSHVATYVAAALAKGGSQVRF